MSQAGVLDVVGSTPAIPIQFDADTGSAVPVANVLNILGGANITTTGSGNTITIAVHGTTNHALQVGNSSGSLTSLAVATNGQLPIGSTGADPVIANITSTGGTVTITNGAGSINLEAGGGVAITFDGDTGTANPSAGVITFNANSNSGSTVKFSASGSTVSLLVTDALTNTIIGNLAGNGTISGGGNVGLGNQTFSSLTSGVSNVAVGSAALVDLLSGSGNVGIGPNSLAVLTTGSGNMAIGINTLQSLVGGSQNIALGSGALQFVAGGSNNIAVGTSAGVNYSTTDSNNISIGNAGVAAESNTIRIGTQGSGSGQQNICYIAGIEGVSVSNKNFVTINTVTGQLGSDAGTGTGFVQTLTGNSGGAISPTAGNINTLGTGSITIVGSGSTLTTELTGLTNHNVLVGAGTATVTNVAPSATSGVPLISQGSSSDPAFGTAVVAGGGTGATSFSINGAVFSNTTTTGALQAATLTSGQLLIGGTTTPAAATLTAGTGISITNGNNSISIAVSGSAVLETLTGNSGGAISPTAGNINTLGTGSITIAGSGSTLTTQLTGLTNHNVLVGAGSATITNVAPSATAGIPLVSGGSSADPSFTTAVVAGGGTGNTTFTAYSVICAGTTATGAFQNVSGVGSSGQVLTSNGASALPTWQASSGSSTWTDENTSFAAVAGNGYFITGTATATLPASPSQGNQISFIVDAANVLTIQANTGQTIRIGGTVSASAGTAASNARGDAVSLIYRTSDTSWIALHVLGTFTVT